MKSVPSRTSQKRGRPPKLARNDCSTCVGHGLKCDRTRPRCQNCQRSGNLCSGFTMHLSWQPGFSTHRKPSKKGLTRSPRWQGTTAGDGQLEFISEFPGGSKPDENHKVVLLATSRPQVTPHTTVLSPPYNGNLETTKDIPASIMYAGHFERFESLLERCR